MRSVVRSPARPRSSSSARRTTGSISRSCGGRRPDSKGSDIVLEPERLLRPAAGDARDKGFRVGQREERAACFAAGLREIGPEMRAAAFLACERGGGDQLGGREHVEDGRIGGTGAFECGNRRQGPRQSFGVALETDRSEEHTSELQSRFGISYAAFCLKKKKKEVERLFHAAQLLSRPHQARSAAT